MNTDQKKKSENEKITVLRNLGHVSYTKEKFEEARKYYKEAEECFNLDDSSDDLADTLSMLGGINAQLGHYEQSMIEYNKALKIYKKLDNQIEISMILGYLASVYLKKGDHAKSLEYALQSLEEKETLGINLSSSYNTVGSVYWYLKDFSNSLKYYLKGLKYNKMSYLQNSKDRIEYAFSLNNVAMVYGEIGNNPEALKHYYNALKILREINNRHGISYVLNNIGYINFKCGELDKSREHYLESLSIKKDINDNWGIAGTLVNLADLEIQSINFELAQNYLSEALSIAELIHAEEKKKEIFHSYYELYLKKYDHARALEYFILFTETKEKIFAEEQAKKIAEMQSKYETEKSEREKEIYRLKNIELENINQQLDLARKEAEQANRLKSEFLAGFSHEIRTPLNAIIGYGNILKEQIRSSKQQSFAANIQTAGKNLLHLIDDILDLSKIEAGRIKIKPCAVNLKSFITDIISTFQYKTFEKQIQLSYEIDKKVPDKIKIDEIRLRQILFNLVGNAVKFTDEGSVQIHISAELKLKNRYNILIEIRDTGKGIPKDQLNIIFEPFRQVKNQDEIKFGGTGLGLAITKRLIAAMNGSISVESKVNFGSVFKIILTDIEATSNKVADDIKNNSLISDSLEILDPEIKNKIKQEYFEQWHDLNTSFSFDEISTYCNQLQKFAKDNKLIILKKILNEIKAKTRIYNYTETKKSLSKLKCYFEEL